MDTQWGCPADGKSKRKVVGLYWNNRSMILSGCPTYVFGGTGVRFRRKRGMSDVCAFVTKEVWALVGNDFETLLRLQAWLAYLDYGEWRGQLVLKRGLCVCEVDKRERTNERSRPTYVYVSRKRCGR